MYKTLQVTPDRTVNNKRGSDFARAMHEYMYLPFHSRISVSERKLEPLDAMWWVVILKRSGITFSLCVDESQSTFAKQRLAHYWERASIVESELQPCEIENTSISQLKYSRHNIFALSADWREDTIPMSSILQVVKDMHDDDEARLYVGLQPYSRTAWSDWATAAHESFKTGKTPQRRSAQAYTGWKAGVKLLDSAMSEVMSAVDVLFSSNTEAKMMDAKRRQKPDYDKREIMMDGKLSRETLAKRNEPVFRTFIYVVSHSPDNARRQITLSGLCNAFTELSGDNELVQVKLSTACLQRVNNLKIPHSFDPCLMSCSEVGKLIQLPTASLQDEYAEHMNAIDKRETDLPKHLFNDMGVLIGDVTFRGESHAVYFPVAKRDYDELCLPRAVIGGMGTGKTCGFGGNWGAYALSNDFSVFSIDVAKDELGTEIERGATYLNWPSAKVVHVEFGKNVYRLDWPESQHGTRSANRLAGELLNFFNLHDAQSGIETARYLRIAAKTIGAIGGSFCDIEPLFIDDDYRERILKRLPSDLRLQWSAYDKLSIGMRGKVLDPILNRLDMLTGDEYLKACVHSSNQIDFTKWITGGYHVRIHVPKRELGPEATDILVDFILSKIELAMFARPEDEQIPAFVLLDEPHQFKSAAPRIERMVSESRKWRLGMLLMFHLWDQMPRTLANAIKASGAHYHVYKTSSAILRDLRAEIAPFTVEEGLQLPRHYAINVIHTRNETVKPFISHMAPPPSLWRDTHEKTQVNT